MNERSHGSLLLVGVIRLLISLHMRNAIDWMKQLRIAFGVGVPRRPGRRSFLVLYLLV